MDLQSSASNPESCRSQTHPEKPRRRESTSSAGSQSRFSISSTPPAQNRENPDPPQATRKAREVQEPLPIAAETPKGRKFPSAPRARCARGWKLTVSTGNRLEKFRGTYPALLRVPKPSRGQSRTAQ